MILIVACSGIITKKGELPGKTVFGSRRDQYPRTRQSANRVDIDLILNHDSSSHRILVMVRRKGPRPLGGCRSLGWIETLNSGRRFPAVKCGSAGLLIAKAKPLPDGLIKFMADNI